MSCPRCCGYIIKESFISDNSEDETTMIRCMICGYRGDDVMMINRMRSYEELNEARGKSGSKGISKGTAQSHRILVI